MKFIEGKKEFDAEYRNWMYLDFRLLAIEKALPYTPFLYMSGFLLQ